MTEPKSNRQAIVDYVQGEIEQYKSDETDRFMTNHELGKQYGVSGKRVSRFICESNIPISDLELRRTYFHKDRGINISLSKLKGKNKPSKEEMETLYSKMPTTQIASLLGVHKSTVLDWLKQYDIERKNSNDWIKGNNLSEEHKKRIRKSCKLNAPRGKQHYRFNESNNLGDYTRFFVSVMREYIRARDDYTCQFCGASENGKKHAVHHIDHNKNNNSEFNLITLCQSKPENCHINETSSTGELREEWIQYCQEKVQEIYAEMTPERRSELEQLKSNLETRLSGAA